MNDRAIPLARCGRVYQLAEWFALEFSEREPAAYHEFVRHRYVACLLRPTWGELF